MKAQDNIKEELKELAPTLSKVDKAPPKTVPEGYFDKMHVQLMLKVRQEEIFSPKSKNQEENTPTWLEELIKWLKPAYTMPALAILLILILTLPFNKIETVDNDLITVTELSDEAIQNYLSESSFLEEDLLEDVAINNEINTDLTDEELNNYILENTDDLNLNEWL